MAVYCAGCGTNLLQYKEIGQAIKDKARAVALKKTGKVVLSTWSFGPLGGVVAIASDYKFLMNAEQTWKAHIGSRRDALNAGQFPCPKCQKYVRWKRR